MSHADALVDHYFRWLVEEAIASPSDRIELHGLLCFMHDIPFTWLMWSDENRSGDALSFRQSDFLAFYNKRILSCIDEVWLGQWATATPSVLEVLLGMARRWSFYFEEPAHHFFSVMMMNLNLFRFIGSSLSEDNKIRVRFVFDCWMNRQFDADGSGSPFPIVSDGSTDMRTMDIWSQMNAYSAQNFQ